MAHVLVVEDEPNLRLLLTRLLGGAGYEVSAAATGVAGLNAALGDEHDLVILDLMLPDVEGEHVLHVLLANRPSARVMVLSSVTEVGRRVGVLDSGAVDFVAKPFANAEMLARVRARVRNHADLNRSDVAGHLGGASVQLDSRRRQLVMDGRRVELSQREFVLYAHLLHRKGEVCTRQELLADVWGVAFDPGTNVVDVCVRRLRAKIAAESIETVRNVGYRLVAC
jgi:DNA-binding response OmpR family regulator